MHNLLINNIDDLIANPSFKRWILVKNEQDGALWDQWIAENPDKLEWVATAKVMIQLLEANQHTLEASEIDKAAALIQAGIAEQYMETEQPAPAVIPLIRRFRWAIAASVLVIIGTGIYYLRPGTAAGADLAYEVFAEKTKNTSIDYRNNSAFPQSVTLSDGSQVILEQNSSISYAGNSGSLQREVFLTGSAFFNVVRKPSQPFIVYTQNIVTKVLGTSFWIKAIPAERTASVTVQTGKVSVYRNVHFTGADSTAPHAKGIIVTPNQRLDYDIAKEQINKALIAAPLITDQVIPSFEFDETPAAEVFKELEKAYGISILTDEHTLASCSVTAELQNENFYDKLAIICRIINATYEVVEGNVIINSKGCR